MVYKIENTNKLDKEITNLIGESLSKEKSFKSVDSCLFRLIDIKVANEQIDLNLSTDVRCNFELFQKGVLLRMNDAQDFYAIPLTCQQNIKLDLIQGEKRIALSFYGDMMRIFGFKKSYLEQFWIFRQGTYYERFTLEIRTDDEILTLDSHGQNYYDSVGYFRKSKLSERLTTHNT